MATATRMCQITSCKRQAATLCYHCHLDVCGAHFKEHSSSIMVDIHSLADQVNNIADGLDSLSINDTRESLFKQLKQWRDQNVKSVEDVYEQKYNELKVKLCQEEVKLIYSKNKKQQEITEIKEKISAIIDADEATLDQAQRLRTSIDRVILDVETLPLSSICIETRPLEQNIYQLVNIINRCSKDAADTEILESLVTEDNKSEPVSNESILLEDFENKNKGDFEDSLSTFIPITYRRSPDEQTEDEPQATFNWSPLTDHKYPSLLVELHSEIARPLPPVCGRRPRTGPRFEASRSQRPFSRSRRSRPRPRSDIPRSQRPWFRPRNDMQGLQPYRYRNQNPHDYQAEETFYQKSSTEHRWPSDDDD